MNTHPPQVHHRGVSEELIHLITILDQEGLTWSEFLKVTGRQGMALLAFAFSLPFLLPIPIPGLSILLGLVIAALGLGLALDRSPWLPRSWRSRKVPSERFKQILAHGLRLTRRLETLVKPRWAHWFLYRWVRGLAGLMILFAGAFLALPLPPGTNFPPALAILSLSLALIERDAVFLVLGGALFAANIALFGKLAQVALDFF